MEARAVLDARLALIKIIDRESTTINRKLRPLKRIIHFLNRYPPSLYSSLRTGQSIPTLRQRRAMGAKPLSSTNVPQAKSIPSLAPVPAAELSELPTIPDEFTSMLPKSSETTQLVEDENPMTFPPNPFLPYKNPETGNWRGARVGLRQQADLCKWAREYGVEVLLPSSRKSSGFKQQRILERGLAVKGTGEGQQVKGHKWERQRSSTLEKRVKAMEEMPELIRRWEQFGHGKRWKKWPKEKSS